MMALPLMAAATLAPACWVLTTALPAGATVNRTQLTPGPCPERPVRLLRHDTSSGRNVARQDLAPGTALGRLWVPETAVAPGQKLRLISHIGPVIVEREVEAVQAAGPGKPLFVRVPGERPFPAPPVAGVQP